MDIQQAIKDYITSHDKVWVTTSGEIADYYYANYYKEPAALAAITG